MKNACYLIILLVTSFITISAAAQQNEFYFSRLSKEAYESQLKEIKLRKPVKAYDDKDQEKYYESIVQYRNDALAKEIETNQFVRDTLLLNKCYTILNKIKAANSGYNYKDVNFYINRSAVANAASMGEGSIFVNLGLFLWIDNEDELAMVLGHELAHYFLAHFEKKISNNIQLLTSDDFKAEMKSIKKSDDGKYVRFRKLLKDLSSQTGTHSRFKETEADSLSYVFIKNAGYNVTAAAKMLLKLDNSEQFFTEKGLYDLRQAFESVTEPYLFDAPKKKYNGLSQVEVTMNADKDFDSIKTHPDCKIRYTTLTRSASFPECNCCTAINSQNKSFKKRALIELVRNSYENGNMTFVTHLCLFALQSGYNDPFFTDMISMAFSGMTKAEQKMERFSATNAGAKPGSTLKELQEFIFKLDKQHIQAISKFYLEKSTVVSEDHEFALFQYNQTYRLQEADIAKTTFLRNFPQSKYSYLLKP